MKSIAAFIFLFFSLYLLSGCLGNKKEIEKRIPVLVFTDFGRDVDDAEAFTYLVDNEELELVGVVCCSYISEVRAFSLFSFLKLLGVEVPIAVGSDLPIGKRDSSLIYDYLVEHSINGIPYEISLRDSLVAWANDSCTIDSFTSEVLMDSLLNEYAGELRVVILSQFTDVAIYFIHKPEQIEKVHSIYIQGQAVLMENGSLMPDQASYNIREDSIAADGLFSFQEQVPFILLGKYAAYPMAYTRDEFDVFAERNGKAGAYLLEAAYKGLECFASRDSAMFYRVFNISDSVCIKEAFRNIDKVSNPYDMLTVIALDKEELFHGERIGQHLLIGMEPEKSCFKDYSLLKKILLKENY